METFIHTLLSVYIVSAILAFFCSYRMNIKGKRSINALQLVAFLIIPFVPVVNTIIGGAYFTVILEDWVIWERK